MRPHLLKFKQSVGGGRCLLFFDYDGTLVEIAPRPELARPTPEVLELLSRLAAQEDLKVMVVSGRPLRDLQELLPVPGLDFLGSHGGEAFIGGCLHRLLVTTIMSKNFPDVKNGWRRGLRLFGGGGLRTSLRDWLSTIGSSPSILMNHR